jgi:hypothetical protein
MRGYRSPFVGFFFFISKPKLWLVPLLGMLVAWFSLFVIFIMVAYSVWPEKAGSHVTYVLNIAQALAVSSLVVLITWLIVLPVFFNMCFEKLLKKVFLIKGDVLASPSFFNMIASSMYVFIKTLGWRLLWVLIGVLTFFIWTPMTLVVVQLGMAYTALLDGCDLSLSLKGVVAKRRLVLIRKYHLEILFGAIVAGIVSAFLLPTFLIWLFWIPSIYIGAYFWTYEWSANHD